MEGAREYGAEERDEVTGEWRKLHVSKEDPHDL